MAPDFRGDEIHIRIRSRDESSCDDESYLVVNMHFFLAGELHVMARPRDESIAKTLKRFVATVKKKLAKSLGGKGKSKKPKSKSSQTDQKSSEVPEDGDKDEVVVTSSDDLVVDTETFLNEHWTSGMKISYGSIVFTVVRNAPTVTSITVFPRSCLMCGYPIVPTVDCEYADGIDYEWCAEEGDALNKTVRIVGTERVYTPKESELNCRLKVYCTPWRYNVSEDIVVDAPEPEECSRSVNIIRGRTATHYMRGSVSTPPPIPRMLEVRKDFISRRQHKFNGTDRSSSNSNNGNSGSTTDIDNSDVTADTSNNMSNNNSNSSSCNSSSTSANDLRVVTYNTLAEPFAISDYAVKCMFSYCPREYLDTEYRLQLVVQEMIAYNADVIALQECDAKVFKQYLRPVMRSRGYTSHYTNKSSGVREGCAMFTKDAVLRVLRTVDLPTKNVLRHAQYLQGIYECRPDLRDVLGGKLGTVGQIVVVAAVNNDSNTNSTLNTSTSKERVLILANTHLFYHPAAAFARLLQTDAILRSVMSIRDAIKGMSPVDRRADSEGSGSTSDQIRGRLNKMKFIGEEPPDEEFREKDVNLMACDSDDVHEFTESDRNVEVEVSTIFMGDLNSTPETAVIEYLHTGVIPPDHEVWSSVNDFRWGARAGEEETSTNGDPEPPFAWDIPAGLPGGPQSPSCTHDYPTPMLTHDLKLLSAAGFPPYTNFTGGFKDLLDYIFIEDGDGHFEVTAVAPFPSLDQLAADTALPSQVFPSDHIAVAVDLRFKN